MSSREREMEKEPGVVKNKDLNAAEKMAAFRLPLPDEAPEGLVVLFRRIIRKRGGRTCKFVIKAAMKTSEALPGAAW